MKVVIGSDHAGFDLKEAVIEHLIKEGVDIEDVGTYKKESCDYPVIAKKVANEVISGNFDKGIVICGSGLGVAIAANKVKGIRAVTCSEPLSAKLSRQHNNANVLTMGERIIGVSMALEIVDIFLKTPFEGGRHQKRVDMIE